MAHFVYLNIEYSASLIQNSFQSVLPSDAICVFFTYFVLKCILSNICIAKHILYIKPETTMPDISYTGIDRFSTRPESILGQGEINASSLRCHRSSSQRIVWPPDTRRAQKRYSQFSYFYIKFSILAFIFIGLYGIKGLGCRIIIF